MNPSNIKTPGVYINEINTFPNSVVPVATAVPAFIGYTSQAEYEGKSYLNKPIKITSFAEFQAFFCYPNPTPPASRVQQYSPQYYLEKQSSKPTSANFVEIQNDYYAILPDPNTIYYLYNSIRLFYDNGGSDAYIVSVGTYGKASKKPIAVDEQIINPNVKLSELKNGLSLLNKEQEPTMYICPDATLLSVEDNGALMQNMLQQCSEMQTAISIFDIIGANHPAPINYTKDIEIFRNNSGTKALKYGAAYYPFVNTTICKTEDINYMNLFGGDIAQLESILLPESQPNSAIQRIINSIKNPKEKSLTIAQYNRALIAASKTYETILKEVLHEVNILPPSGGMAGVITTIDSTIGVWKAPANTSINSVASLPINLTSDQQENLNVDAVSGKSVNAIRSFTGNGILIWGARTLDGNSMDWRYISVRRTMTFLEQSCKLAAQAYVFAPNNKNTWEAVKSMIGSFLTDVWKQGGLQGAKASDAFAVECGLGTTMTSNDILNGFMNVSVKVALVRPAEFIVITFQQQMAANS